MNKIKSQTLKSNGLAKNRPENLKFSYRSSHKYRCGNCNNKIHEKVMRDFVQVMPDNKLCCPWCYSLRIREADSQ
jgi:hypothetical protein